MCVLLALCSAFWFESRADFFLFFIIYFIPFYWPCNRFEFALFGRLIALNVYGFCCSCFFLSLLFFFCSRVFAFNSMLINLYCISGSSLFRLVRNCSLAYWIAFTWIAFRCCNFKWFFCVSFPLFKLISICVLHLFQPFKHDAILFICYSMTKTTTTKTTMTMEADQHWSHSNGISIPRQNRFNAPNRTHFLSR